MPAFMRWIRKLYPWHRDCREKRDEALRKQGQLQYAGGQDDVEEQDDEQKSQGKQEQLHDTSGQDDLEEQDDEQKNQGQQEQLQDTGGQEEQRRMLLTLFDLERTMDPLIAAQVYNNRISLLGRLPEELLLCILDHLGDDILTLYCLRRVSRGFRNLIDVLDIWKHTVPPKFYRSSYISEAYWVLPGDLQIQLRQRLERDGMCDKCILSCGNASSRPVTRDCCQFKSPPSLCLHCDGCGTHHDVQAFPPSNQKSYKQDQDRACLGRQGVVQLCEHVSISWHAIEAHIADWQQRKPGDWQACFDNFNVECHDPSHNTHCAAKEPPSWPRARLQSAQMKNDLVVLSLEWKPCTSLDICTRDGQLDASELRAMFQRYRQGPASILLPSYPSSPLPEMTCFDPTRCSCVEYKMGDNERPSAADLLRLAGFAHWPLKCRNHFYGRHYGYGRNGGEALITKHRPRDKFKPTCLASIYQRDVLVCYKTDCGKINPTHGWFHAMDPDTYPRPHAGYTLPLFKDKGCMNYYRRPKTLLCRVEPTIHQSCSCLPGE